MDKPDEFENILKFFDDKPHFACIVFENQGESIEYVANLPDEFFGDGVDESYSKMVHLVAVMRKISDMLTKHAANYINETEDRVKKDVAEVYYELKKSHERF